MRRRLTAAFLLITLVLLLAFTVIRGFAVRDLLHQQESADLRDDARLIATYVEDRMASAQPVSRGYLEMLLDADQSLRVFTPGHQPVEVQGGGFRAAAAAHEPVTASAVRGDVRVELDQASSTLANTFHQTLPPLLLQLLVLTGVAALLGYGAARWISAPFDRLAEAAAALGRGRFDLDLPETTIPEARAVAGALRVSAHQLEARLGRERTSFQSASHELRTPLTSLRLELEDLGTRPDLDPELAAGLDRGVAAVDQLQATVASLLELARHRSVMEGAEEPLAELAQRVADHWAEQLSDTGISVLASVQGDPQLPITPGPVEQALDQVLTRLRSGARDRVRLDFEADGTQLHIGVSAAARSDTSVVASGEPLSAVLTALGGRCAGDPFDQPGLRIWLPHR